MAADDALYMQVFRKVEKLIRSGTLRAGERIPSVRRAGAQHGVSVTTVKQAYLALEDHGLIEARPKSGFFVRARAAGRTKASRAAPSPSAAVAVSVGHLQSRLFAAARLPDIVPLGGAAPGPDLLPTVRLNRILASLSRTAGRRGVGYDMPPGDDALRRQIAKRALDAGVDLSAEEIITTCGGTEALLLCLRAATMPGDIVAVESPAYFGLLHAMEVLGLRALEIPMLPHHGMDLNALERALKSQKVAACVAVPSFSNPHGSLMPDDARERLVAMLSRRDIPLIEDDVFGELHFGEHRPRAAKSYDRKQLVMLCGSFSKTLAPGYRVGWTAPGRYLPQVQTLKLISTLATPTLPELAIAGFLANGGCDHYLRSVRKTYAENIRRMRQRIVEVFPAPVRISDPQGGFILWIELPESVDALKLDDLALAENISIAPGPMFSAARGFRNFIRLSCGHPWSERIDRAIVRLGVLVRSLMK